MSGQEVYPHPYAQKDIADLADYVQRKKTLRIIASDILRQSGKSADEDRTCREDGNYKPPDLGVLRWGKHPTKDAQYSVDAELGHDSAEGGGSPAGCGGVSIGKPVPEGKHSRLGDESDEPQSQEQMHHQWPRRGEVGHRLFAGCEGEGMDGPKLPYQDSGNEHACGGGMSNKDIFEAGPQIDGIALFKDHQHIGAGRHYFPEDDEEEPVGGTYQTQDTGKEEKQWSVIAGEMFSLMPRHVVH